MLYREAERTAEMRSELTEMQERAVELDSLRRQLALPSFASYRSIAANVIARETSTGRGTSVLLQNSRTMGDVYGLNSIYWELDISTDVSVQEGESVVTTGLDRIYPKGLLVGTVERIEQDSNAPFNKIVIKPTAPIDRLEHVLVLLVEAKDLKLDDGTK